MCTEAELLPLANLWKHVTFAVFSRKELVGSFTRRAFRLRIDVEL